jgi:mannose-6-phosphate isomerase-like protein (cupin superfamily)
VKVTRRGGGAVLWHSDAGGRAVLMVGTEPPDVVELWDWTLGAGDRYVSQPHAAGTRELLHVHQGRVTIELADTEVALTAGDAMTFAGEVAHAYANPTRRVARFSLAVFEPRVGRTSPTEQAHA